MWSYVEDYRTEWWQGDDARRFLAYAWCGGVLRRFEPNEFAVDGEDVFQQALACSLRSLRSRVGSLFHQQKHTAAGVEEGSQSLNVGIALVALTVGGWCWWR
jgi:hypothetical protein